MIVGPNIRRFRDQSKLSLSELAERANVSKGYLSALENETADPDAPHRRPSGQVLYRIAEALGVTVADLLGETIDPGPAVPIPPSLRAFADVESLPETDVTMLAQIQFRGAQPSSIDGWSFLYNAIKYSASR